MSGWNYRVVRRTVDGGAEFAIHECYYDDDGRPGSISYEPVCPIGETLAELRGDMIYYLRALKRPVLRYEAFP